MHADQTPCLTVLVSIDALDGAAVVTLARPNSRWRRHAVRLTHGASNAAAPDWRTADRAAGCSIADMSPAGLEPPFYLSEVVTPLHVAGSADDRFVADGNRTLKRIVGIA